MKPQGLDLALKIAEQHQMRDLESKISARMRQSMNDHGSRAGIRSMTLANVVAENYVKAVEDLKSYTESRHAYPQFKARAERYLTYAVDLINAIRAKRSFPGIQHLNMSKQQDLLDRALSHFEDLKVTMKKIEQIESEVKLDDVRSTVWVLQAVIYSVFAMLALGFLLELSRGVLPAANIVADDTFGALTNMIFDKLGF